MIEVILQTWLRIASINFNQAEVQDDTEEKFGVASGYGGGRK
jgi:hypothetical protein